MSAPTMPDLHLPRRIKRERTPGWRMAEASTNPLGLVYVGRARGAYGKWGNPFEAGKHCEFTRFDGTRISGTPKDRATAARLFDWWLPTQPELLAAAREVLTGRDVACWCPLGDLCHGDVWLHWTSPRGNTPDTATVDEDGRRHRTIATKRHCNGCTAPLGDPTAWEMACVIAGYGLPDVRPQCPTCSAGGGA